ncbi:MAG: hypothetical protein FWD14_03520 [Treponema sp.]|nr:hypothetical protein [Treponema sp.]
MDVLIKYFYECINVEMNTDGEFQLLLIAGKDLIDGCKMTFNETIEKIKKRKTYKNKNEILDKAFEEYNNVIESFDYNYFIERFLDIYKLPQYK